ncbi:MAG: DUF1365 domain-containing protein [Rhodospirillales bacterium]|nr:DUF1365 domain-containing protein [Rhodospirillales bacterium]
MQCEHVQGRTLHARRGKIANRFTYGVDYLLCDPERFQAPRLLSKNAFNLWSLNDRHHGGERGQGRGVAWFRELLAGRGCPFDGTELLLLAQPAFLGIAFNPVSFWIALRQGRPCAVVAEVNNTFGQRHCYFCAHDDFRPIDGRTPLEAQKLFHVSPFQQVQGRYRFQVDMTENAISIGILYCDGAEGLIATLEGCRRQATMASLAWAALRRPFGAGRVLALIYWQALKLCLKGAPFHSRPQPPTAPVSYGRSVREPEA